MAEAKNMEKEAATAAVEMWKYTFGFVEMAVIKCAIELGIAEAVDSHIEGPPTLSALSSSLCCSSSSLFRIMRFLVTRKIFKEVRTSHGEIEYQQTPLSRLLTRRGEDGVASLLLLESSPVMLAPWHGLSARVLDERNPTFDAAHGDDLWGYAASHPAHSKLLNDAMACIARMVVPVIVDTCPQVFDGLTTVVDVGGGNGTALRTLVRACPWIRGINFDLPHVVSALVESRGVEYVGGDMFDSVPRADAVFIMQVLHDWGDEECIQILKNCREAIPADKGKVIIVEAVIEEGENGGDNELNDVGLMLDMIMMAHTTTGKERTLKEWEYVIKGAGFNRYTVNPTRAVQSVIEAYP